MDLSHKFKNRFLLEPEITYLNFGSFGACPKPVFEDYMEWQRLLESEPVQFIAFDGPQRVRSALKVLADYISCEASDLVFTPNPTFAVNIIAANLPLNPGDEVLSTNLEYGALDRTWKFYCEKKGANYVQSQIELPIQSEEHFLDSFWKGYNDQTKAIFISHITSATAIKLPVEAICREARKRGLITIVDGAHVPGHFAFSIQDLDPDFYTGACHKWMMAPKGCSFLYAKKTHQSYLEPIIVSWGYQSDTPSDSTFFDYHQFNGTRDFSAYLTLPKCVAFMRENNWDEVSTACKSMVLENAERFCNLVNSVPIAPLNNRFIGQMFSIPVNTNNPVGLQKRLFEKHRIELPITRNGDRFFARYSIQAFNNIADLESLYQALSVEIADGSLLQRF